MKIKILRIMHRINIGGPTYHAAFLTKHLNNNKFKTKLISGNIDNEEKSGEYILNENKVKVTYVKNMFRKISLINDLKALINIIKIIREFRPDIVHTHAAKSGTLGRLAAFFCKVPVIIHTFHGHIFHSYFGKYKNFLFLNIERLLTKISTKIITISDLQFDELVNDFKIGPKKKFTVIPLGFDLKRFYTNKSKKRMIFRREFNLKNSQIAIGIVGRLDPIKNHSLFLNAIRNIKLKSKKNVVGFIIGDGIEKIKLQNLCDKLNLSFNNSLENISRVDIVFTSWRHDLDFINAGLDIMTLTSLNEGTPVSLIEAQAAGLPIVTTDVGGIRDIVIENETALISESNNLEEFSNKLINCIENKKLRLYLSKKGKDNVIPRFDKTRLVNDITKLYKHYKK